MCGTDTTNNNKRASRKLLSTVAGVAVAMTGIYGGVANAQSGMVLDEIIVTAQKREQSLEDVPASVSAISGEVIRDYLDRMAALLRAFIFAASATSILTSMLTSLLAWCMTTSHWKTTYSEASRCTTSSEWKF